jgi:hypothetical protein
MRASTSRISCPLRRDNCLRTDVPPADHEPLNRLTSSPYVFRPQRDTVAGFPESSQPTYVGVPPTKMSPNLKAYADCCRELWKQFIGPLACLGLSIGPEEEHRFRDTDALVWVGHLLRERCCLHCIRGWVCVLQFCRLGGRTRTGGALRRGFVRTCTLAANGLGGRLMVTLRRFRKADFGTMRPVTSEGSPF